MKLKAGAIWTESGKTQDAVWEYSPDKTIDVSTQDDYLVLRIDPEDLLAIADAVSASLFREAQINATKLQK